MLAVQTAAPRGLLDQIKRAIDAGKIVTWEYDKDGDFTHVPNQWRCHAWLRPTVSEGTLSFKIIENTKIPLTEETYGVYHGRFVEMLLAHFRDRFSFASAN